MFAKSFKLRALTGVCALLVMTLLPMVGLTAKQPFEVLAAYKIQDSQPGAVEVGKVDTVGPTHAGSVSPNVRSDVGPSWSYWVTGGAVVMFVFCILAVLLLIRFSRRLQNEVAVRRLAEAAVRQSEQRLSIVIDHAADMIFFHDMQGRFKIVNQSACDRLGYTKEELVQLTAKDIDAQFHMQNDLLQIWKGLKDGGSTIIETKLRSQTSELIPVEINLKLFQYQNEPWVLAVVREIGRRKMVEAQLRRSHKMEALGTLCGGIAHDFNNILGIILGSAELAMDDVPSTNPARGCLKEIKKATRRARDIVHQILAFTHKVGEENKSIDLAASVEAALKLVRATVPATIAIETRLPADKIVVLSNAAQISQIMVNLCANAAHAMQQGGGTMTIALEQYGQGNPPSTHFYPEIPDGICARLTVKDTGLGIAPEVIDRIFDPYFTTKKGGQGTGMGLAVVHGTVKMMGGNIYCRSTLGKGTSMVVMLPMVDAKAKLPSINTVRIPRGSEWILFVDDEAAMVRYCKRMLERLGYRVTGFTDPIEALVSFRSQPGDFDLVITDMTMPGMTGDKLALKMMKIRSDIPVVLCTGHSELLDEKAALDIGIKAFHMKPFDRMELAATIRIVLDGDSRDPISYDLYQALPD